MELGKPPLESGGFLSVTSPMSTTRRLLSSLWGLTGWLGEQFPCFAMIHGEEVRLRGASAGGGSSTA